MKPRVWRALLVDDNAINLEVAAELLMQLGMQTDSASGGAQAVAQAEAVAYDLIVMDVQMPGMDGRAATRLIRQLRAQKRLPPIIALTANANADDRDACLAAGMDDYLTKPVSPQQLHRALQRWLPDWAEPAEPTHPAQAAAGAARPLTNSNPPLQAPLPMDQMLAAIAAIGGFDLAVSLRNLGGRMPTLVGLLRRFATTYRAGEPALAQAARQGDTAALWQICHSLRGACAVLSAHALVQRIEALEEALLMPHTPATLTDRARPLQTELLALVRQLEAALGSG